MGRETGLENCLYRGRVYPICRRAATFFVSSDHRTETIFGIPEWCWLLLFRQPQDCRCRSDEINEDCPLRKVEFPSAAQAGQVWA